MGLLTRSASAHQAQAQVQHARTKYRNQFWKSGMRLCDCAPYPQNLSYLIAPSFPQLSHGFLLPPTPSPLPSRLIFPSGTCDIDDIVNAVPFADYSSCNGKGSGQVCTPVCIPGTGPVTNASEPINLVCDADGDFTDPVLLTGAAVANVAQLNAPLSNITDIQFLTEVTTEGRFPVDIRPLPSLLLTPENIKFETEQQSGRKTGDLRH